MAVALASGSAISRAAGRNNDVSARRDNFDAFPDELIEHIGYYAATLDPLGPPKDLVSLQLVGRRFYNILSSRTNPRLYVLLFRATFDSDAYFRRLELEATKPENVAMEFKRRYVVLWKFRTLRHCFMEVTPTPVVLPSPLITTSLPPPSPRPLGRSSPLLSSGNHKMPSPSVVAKETLTMLWSAFLMMLENVVLNKRILKDYAKLDVWLQKFWFDPRGASCAMDAMHRDMWPPLQESSTLAMWLLWFSMEPKTYFDMDEPRFRSVIDVLKLIALGAHKYPTSQPEWNDLSTRTMPLFYGNYPPLVAPPLATPAIMSYLCLVPKSLNRDHNLSNFPIAPSEMSEVLTEEEMTSTTSTLSRTLPHKWDCQWRVCLSLARSLSLCGTASHSSTPNDNQLSRIADDSLASVAFGGGLMNINGSVLSSLSEITPGLAISSGSSTVERARIKPTEAFTLGSLEGHWEGLLTYTKFWAYGALITGAPPSVLRRSLVVYHEQNWSLREYHLVSPEEGSNHKSSEPTTRNKDMDQSRPLSIGNMLTAYLPADVDIRVEGDGTERIIVTEPGREGVLVYHRCPPSQSMPTSNATSPLTSSAYQSRIQDILILGDGHSAWGSFTLTGRIRAYDGLVTMVKEYTVREKGKWLYRGYVFGDTYKTFTGRWRDTWNPETVTGYEGACFMRKMG